MTPPQPPVLSGELRRFAIMTGNTHGYRLRSEAEEKADEEERQETRRRRQKRSVTLTVGTVEKIDAAVEVLRAKSLGALASRDKVVDAAIRAFLEERVPLILKSVETANRP